jgi:uncharacterized protein
VIDALAFARQARSDSGSIPLSGLPRLREAVRSEAGQVQFSVTGGSDGRGRPILRLTVVCTVRLECQRCLGSIEMPLQLESSLLLAADEEEADRWMDEEEAADAIVASRHLDVGALVEDEVLLALPYAPRHPEGGCKPPV